MPRTACKISTNNFCKDQNLRRPNLRLCRFDGYRRPHSMGERWERDAKESLPILSFVQNRVLWLSGAPAMPFTSTLWWTRLTKDPIPPQIPFRLQRFFEISSWKKPLKFHIHSHRHRNRLLKIGFSASNKVINQQTVVHSPLIALWAR